MDTGYTDLPEFLQRIQSMAELEFRLVALRDGQEWKTHTLVLEHTPHPEGDVAPHELVPMAMDYGTAYFDWGKIDGRTAVQWLRDRTGELTPVGKSGPVWRFRLPPFNSDKVSWQRFPSYAMVDYGQVPTPLTRYEIKDGSPYMLPQLSGFLLADGLPFYPDLKTGVLRFAYRIADSEEQARYPSVDPAIIVRLANSEGWLSHIKLSPTAITVTVSGSRVIGAHLTISGSGGTQFQQQLRKRGSVECPLPKGVPTPLWIVLSQGNQWLDYYHRDERWLVTSLQPGNVTLEAGDPSAGIAALIAQGEGVTTEFKETIPADHNQMLKTVAAFANGEGGVLLLGVKDRTGEIVGFSGNADDITQMIRSVVSPEPSVSIEEATVEHRRILAVNVQRGPFPPYGLHAANPRYYVRRGATTFPARPEELRAIVLVSQQTISGPFAGYVV